MKPTAWWHPPTLGCYAPLAPLGKAGVCVDVVISSCSHGRCEQGERSTIDATPMIDATNSPCRAATRTIMVIPTARYLLDSTRLLPLQALRTTSSQLRKERARWGCDAAMEAKSI